jgi:predicted MFS family arabinose efflux permease
VIPNIKVSLLKRSLYVQVPAFIGVRTVINTMMRMVYPFLPIFGRGLEVDLRLLTLAITFRSASGVLGPLLASVGDSHGRKTGMLFGMSLFTAGAFIMVLWPSYPAFFLSLVLGIMANFVFVPSMQAFLGDRVPYERRGLVLGLSELGWSLSFILGVPIVGLVISQQGWQAPFPWLTGLGVLATLTLWLILPSDRPSTVVRLALMKNLGLVITFLPAVAGIVFALALSASNELINLTFGTWLEGTFDVKIAALAVASAIIGVSELGGEVFSSGLVDWLGKRRAVVIGLTINGLAALGLPFLGQSLTGALTGLFFIYLTFEFTLVSSLPLMTEVLPAARATFMSTYIAAMAVGRAAGALIVPFAYNLDSPQSNQMGLLPIVLIAASLNVIAFIALRSVRTSLASEAEPMIV